jgi:hypothetical protein
MWSFGWYSSSLNPLDSVHNWVQGATGKTDSWTLPIILEGTNTTDESDYHPLQRFTLPIIIAIRNVAEYKKPTATCIERAHLNPQTLYKGHTKVFAKARHFTL